MYVSCYISEWEGVASAFSCFPEICQYSFKMEMRQFMYQSKAAPNLSLFKSVLKAKMKCLSHYSNIFFL